MGQGISASPTMSASSQAVTTKAGDIFSYEIIQSDKDTITAGGQSTSVDDPTIFIRAERIVSMSQLINVSWKAKNSDGSVVWRIVGKAALIPGVYFDEWGIWNGRSPNDPGYDPPYKITQEVNITPNV